MDTVITISQIQNIIYNNGLLSIDDTVMDKVRKSYDFLSCFSQDKIIYGINTGFGPMAQWRVENEYIKELQYNLIRSHSTGVGKPLSPEDVTASMIARVGTILQAKSGVHPDVVTLLVEFINHRLIPFVPQHGSVGASGDLVQLAHMALCLIGEGKIFYQQHWYPSQEVLAKENLNPLTIHIREGLCLTNGTSVMTGINIINYLHGANLLQLSMIASLWMNEIVESFDDFMSEPLNTARKQKGQIEIAQQIRTMAADSHRLKNRKHDLYSTKHDEKIFNEKIQEYYSLRCTPQILGPIKDTLDNMRTILETEVNGVSDNPIVDYETENVYHGGNFHGDYISLEADKEKIVITRLAMLAERQLNYLFHHRINGDILPPFLNAGRLGLNYGMQACQFTATSTTAECQTLAMPNYVHSIPNNNDNQDIVSMGTNSALLCRQVIENTYQVMAILFTALAQATDILSIETALSSHTRKCFNEIRTLTDKRTVDKPFYEDLNRVITHLMSKVCKNE